jgi:hypothetical protein
VITQVPFLTFIRISVLKLVQQVLTQMNMGSVVHVFHRVKIVSDHPLANVYLANKILRTP